jgi:hypothetical protein
MAERIDEILTPEERVTLKSIIRGEEPVDSLSLEKREETARYFRDVAVTLSEKQEVESWERAAAYNVARAEYLLERIDLPPGDVAPSRTGERDGTTFVELLEAGADFGPWVELALEGVYTQEDADAAELEDDEAWSGDDEPESDDEADDDDGYDEPDDDEQDNWDDDADADGDDDDGYDDEQEREEQEEREREEQEERECDEQERDLEEQEQRDQEEQDERDREEQEEREQDDAGSGWGQDDRW